MNKYLQTLIYWDIRKKNTCWAPPPPPSKGAVKRTIANILGCMIQYSDLHIPGFPNIFPTKIPRLSKTFCHDSMTFHDLSVLKKIKSETCGKLLIWSFTSQKYQKWFHDYFKKKRFLLTFKAWKERSQISPNEPWYTSLSMLKTIRLQSKCICSYQQIHYLEVSV